MTTLEDHNQQNILLANSLVVKFIDAAAAMNQGLIAEGYDIPSDRRQWKYFLNLAGIKHETNNNILINVIETGETHLLTKETLTNYPYTKKELLKNSVYYKELMSRYPDDYVYIHGCLYPVDIDVAISAKDGTILAYNPTMVEPNEYNLIKELESYIKSYVNRWHVRPYTLIEELYFPAFLSTLYASLPNKIANLRLEKMLTSEAHSFHVEHTLRSNLNIYDGSKFLSDTTIMWLYKNIPHLKRNIGKESTFHLVKDTIMSPNKIGIGKYNLFKNNPILKLNRKLDESKWTFNTVSVNVEGLNKYLTSDGLQKPTTDVIVEELKETFVNELSEQDKQYISNVSNIIKDQFNHDITYSKDMGTKVVELESYKYIKRQGQDLFKICLDYWINSVRKGKIMYTVNYTDPNDNVTRLLTPRAGLLMLIKVILHITGNPDVKLTKIHYDLVLKSGAESLTEAYKLCLYDSHVEKLLPILKDAYPPVDKLCSGFIAFGELIDNVLNFFTKVWTLDGAGDNSIVSGNLRYLMEMVTERGAYELTADPNGKHIDELLKEEHVEFPITNGFDLNLSLEALIKSLMGIKLDELDLLRRVAESFKILFGKLLSYTTQILTTDIGEKSIYVFYNNFAPLRSATGAIRIEDQVFRPLEEEHAKPWIHADNFVPKGTNMSMRGIEAQAYGKEYPWDVTGYIRNVIREIQEYSTPTTNVMVYNPVPLRNNRYEFDKIAITKVNATMVAKEQNYAKVSVTAFPYAEEVGRAYISRDPSVRGYTEPDNMEISGFNYSLPQSILNSVSMVVVQSIDDKELQGTWKQPDTIKDLKGKMEALEISYPNTVVRGLSATDTPQLKYGVPGSIDNRIFEQPSKLDIQGGMVITQQEDWSTPTISAFVEDTGPGYDSTRWKEPKVLYGVQGKLISMETVYPQQHTRASAITDTPWFRYAVATPVGVRGYYQPPTIDIHGGVIASKGNENVSVPALAANVIDKTPGADVNEWKEPVVLKNVDGAMVAAEEIYADVGAAANLNISSKDLILQTTCYGYPQVVALAKPKIAPPEQAKIAITYGPIAEDVD